MALDVADVASLHGTVQAWDRWMGCILCPDPAGIEGKVDLLEKQGGNSSLLQTKKWRRGALFPAGNRVD